MVVIYFITLRTVQVNEVTFRAGVGLPKSKHEDGKLQAMKFVFAVKPVPGKRLAWLDTVGREAFGIEKLELALPVLDGTFKLLPL